MGNRNSTQRLTEEELEAASLEMEMSMGGSFGASSFGYSTIGRFQPTEKTIMLLPPTTPLSTSLGSSLAGTLPRRRLSLENVTQIHKSQLGDTRHHHEHAADEDQGDIAAAALIQTAAVGLLVRSQYQMDQMASGRCDQLLARHDPSAAPVKLADPRYRVPIAMSDSPAAQYSAGKHNATEITGALGSATETPHIQVVAQQLAADFFKKDEQPEGDEVIKSFCKRHGNENVQDPARPILLADALGGPYGDGCIDSPFFLLDHGSDAHLIENMRSVIRILSVMPTTEDAEEQA